MWLLLYCHWKKEEEEKKVLNNRISEISPSSLILTRKNRLIEKEVEQQQSLSEQRHQQQQLIVDVYGRASEPICTYHRCSHKFSVHGLDNCKCRHPTNKTLGVFTRYP